MNGLKTELKHSRSFHSAGIPLLVSSAFLRARGFGQIDLARLRKDRNGWFVDVGEVKSSQVGVLAFSKVQRGRLRDSQIFLGGIFGYRLNLIQLIG